MDNNQQTISYNLVEPPAKRAGRNGGHITRYIDGLRSSHPGQWALYPEKFKSPAYFYYLAKKDAGLTVRSHVTEDGVEVYLKAE